MQRRIEIEINGIPLLLLAEKALWWPAEHTLILSDLHFGKSSHFRKAGIPVPDDVFTETATRLIRLLQWHKPDRVIFLGDLFHSSYNREWDHLKNILRQFPAIEFILVQGNHDILHTSNYQQAGFRVEEKLITGPFGFCHAPEDRDNSAFFWCGHLHPGIRLHGRGKQSLTLPVFHVGSQHAVLPAFGAFTGLALQKPKQGERIFALAEGGIFECKGA